MRRAFTLAEVLITLGIIGVVAAITIPTLINKMQDKQFKVAYKKAYSSVSQAFLKMQADSEYLDTTPEFYNENGVRFTKNHGENFKILSKYFKAQKTCFNNDADKCWECNHGEAAFVGGNAPKWLGCQKSSYSFIDNNGMAWHMYFNYEPDILVDVNGFSKPNKLGHDRFIFKLTSANSNSFTTTADKVIPRRDIKNKTRWCPSGNCFYTSWLID